MKFSNKFYESIAYGFLLALIIFLFIEIFKFKNNLFKKIINNNNNNNDNNNNNNNYNNLAQDNKLVEGFGNSLSNNKYNNRDDISVIINRKLKGLNEELGGDKGKNEIKDMLKNTKKISNLECAKCMVNMIEENKKGRHLEIEKLLDDENNDDCIKCKKYSELSNTIQNMIDNI